MQDCSASTKVPGCLLCSSEPCCPEHCCDWDTCKCNDCDMCKQDKLVDENALIPEQQCIVLEGQSETLELTESYPPLTESPEEQTDPNLKRILHSQILKQPSPPKAGERSKITKMRLNKSITLDYEEEKQFVEAVSNSNPVLEELQTQNFAIQAQRKLEKKNPRIFKEKTSDSYIQEAKERSSYAQNRPSSASFRKSQTSDFAAGVRGLRALKFSRHAQPAPFVAPPPPITTASSGSFAVPTPAAFVPTIRSDGAKIFQRKILIKKK